MKHFFLIASCVFTLSSCLRSDEDPVKEMIYKNRLDSLHTTLVHRDSTVNALLAAFNEIELNLDSVARKQNRISVDLERNRGDLRPAIKTRINSQIEAINQLMLENEKKVTELNKKLKSSAIRLREFKNTIALLNEQIVEKNTELAKLSDQLAAYHIQIVHLQVSVDTLSSENYEQSQLIASQTASIHTAYYLVGKSKELSEKNVIDKNGGLLGFGKSARLSEHFSPDNFIKIDYTRVLAIPVNSRKAKLITTHPFDSYILDKSSGKFTQLKILNPEKFWSASRYLVILTGN